MLTKVSLILEFDIRYLILDLRIFNEIFRPIKQLTKKILIKKTSVRILRLEFKSDNVSSVKWSHLGQLHTIPS